MSFDKDHPLETATSNDGQREGRQANAAFSDYARMGARRSLRDLVARYETTPDTAPSTKWSTVTSWSVKFEWVARAKAFDIIQQAADQAAYDARRREIMESGLALTHERVAKLTKLFEKLEGYATSEERIWLPDVKSIGQGEDAERVDIYRFNSALIEQIRGTLDDLAKETGGRIKNVDVKTDGKEIAPIIQIYIPANNRDDKPT
jgi:hypothetical protein